MQRGPLATTGALLGLWRRSLGLQLLSLLCVMCVALTVLASVYDYRTEERQTRDDIIAFGRSLARQAAMACPDAVIATDQLALQSYVDSLVSGERYVGGALVRRSDGKVLASHPSGGIDASDPDSFVVEEPVRLEGSNERLGSVELAVSLRPLRLALEQKWADLLWRTSLAFLLIAALFWGLLHHIVLAPLRRLDQAARQLGKGKLDAPMPHVGGSELGRLGRTLDEMRVNLLASHMELEEQNLHLVSLDRLKSQFLANMSHEMRTPLTGIIGCSEILADCRSEDERRECTSTLHRNGTMLLDLVDQLLDLAKIESDNLVIERQECSLAETITQACECPAVQAEGKGVRLRVDTGGVADLRADTDPARLRRLVGSVVDNAVKFTQKGGSVEVVASCDRVGVSGRLQIVVEDTGIGIRADFMPHLFELFSQADGSLTRNHGGAGVGLALARRIARMLGGDIEITSEEGRGTRARISIHVELLPTHEKPKLPAAKPPMPARLQGRVLVVDDAPDNQRLIKTILTRAGLEVEVVGNGREAVDLVQANAGARQFDLIIMDLQMPVLDGVSAIRELRERGFELPIVALTAHALEEERQRCLDAGADGYELKPITPKKLIGAVSERLPAGAR